MKTVFFIYSTFTPNNAANNRALAYLKSLSTLGYEVTVLFLMPDESFSRMNEELPGIHVEYCWDKNYINHRFIKNISYIHYLFDVYRRVKPGDVVYLYCVVDIMVLLIHKKGVHLYCERTEHPTVYHAQGRLFHPSLRRYLKYCRKVDGLFVISTCLRDYFIENGVSADRVHIVNSIVDLSRFANLDKHQCEPYFAYCGNGNNKKDRVDELIKVFANVAVRHNDIKFYIIGPTKQVFKDEQDNVRLVHELGLEDRVFFTGMKPSTEVPQMLVDSAALFLTRPNTLQNRAGFSTKLVEYLASGNPVVAAGVGDIPLFLIDKKNAFVYCPGDSKAVEDAMEYILANPEKAKRIGEAGKDTAHKYFNALVETQKLIDAFEKSK